MTCTKGRVPGHLVHPAGTDLCAWLTKAVVALHSALSFTHSYPCRPTLINQIWTCSLHAFDSCQSEFRYDISICAWDGNQAKMVEKKSSLLVHYSHLCMIPPIGCAPLRSCQVVDVASWLELVLVSCDIFSLWAKKERRDIEHMSLLPSTPVYHLFVLRHLFQQHVIRKWCDVHLLPQPSQTSEPEAQTEVEMIEPNLSTLLPT